MKKYFSIGETAKINNVSIQALRLYDRMDLLKPAYVDPVSNYRYYTMHQFMYLDLIKYSKLIGAPLKEISDVLRDKNVITLSSFLRNQQKTVDRELIRLKNISRVIGHIEDKIRYTMEHKGTNQVYNRQIEKRFIIDVELNKKDEESDVQIKMRKFDKILEENEIMYEGEVGYFIYSNQFFDSEEISYKSVYSTICVDNVENENVYIKEIPYGEYICIAYLNNGREQAVNILRDYIRNNNYTPKGIIVETEMFNTLDPWENDDLLYELQILI